MKGGRTDMVFEVGLWISGSDLNCAMPYDEKICQCSAYIGFGRRRKRLICVYESSIFRFLMVYYSCLMGAILGVMEGKWIDAKQGGGRGER
jgi:hypothetical protein